MNPILTVNNVSKIYSIHADKSFRTLRDSVADIFCSRREQTPVVSFWALKDISFTAHDGECIGIVGRNGAGKSTLLKIIARITRPTSGSVVLRGRAASLLELGTGFHPELTGRENLFLNATILGESDKNIRRKMDAIIDFAGIEKFIDSPFKRYSTGMQTRLGFAIASHVEGEILIIDEVISTGDFEFRKKCAQKINEIMKSGRTILLVSHNNDSIKKLCSRVIHISQGKMVQDTTNIRQALKTYLDTPAAPLSTT